MQDDKLLEWRVKQLEDDVKKHNAIVDRLDRFTIALESRNKYDDEHKSKIDEILDRLSDESTSHDSRIKELEKLPPIVQQLEENQTIRLDKFNKSKAEKALPYGLFVLLIIIFFALLKIVPDALEILKSFKK